MSLLRMRAALAVVALLPAFAAAAPLTLDQALELAVERSASARAARADVTSAAEAAHAADQLPDPMLTAGIENLPAQGRDRFSTTADSQTMKRIGVSQEWVSHDKREARRAAAAAVMDRQAVAAGAASADARVQTALAYVDAYYAGESLKLTTLDEHRANEEFEAAKARLASSTGGARDVLALSGARGMAEDETADARQARSAAEIALLRWIGAPADELAAPVLPPVPAEAAFVSADPGVMAARRDVDVARRDAAATAAERKPNWSWQASYGQRTGYPDMISFGVSIPLPVARAQRQDRMTAAKLALIEKAEGQLEESTRSATSEYRSLANDAIRLMQRIERYRSAVIEPAHQRAEATLAAYRSSQGRLEDLFEARRNELQAQRKLLDLERDLARSQARLAYKPLTEGDRP